MAQNVEPLGNSGNFIKLLNLGQNALILAKGENRPIWSHWRRGRKIFTTFFPFGTFQSGKRRLLSIPNLITALRLKSRCDACSRQIIQKFLIRRSVTRGGEQKSRPIHAKTAQ